MKENFINYAHISGIVSHIQKSHECFNEMFYIADISVIRHSGKEDLIPLIISETLIKYIKDGDFIDIYGEVRTYNKDYIKNKKVFLFIFVQQLSNINDENMTYVNDIHIIGNICKPPTYRKTPFGREISDIIIAVNRKYGKSDYIPCIAWGKNSRECCNLNVGSKIAIHGRIQSRLYLKNGIKHVVYEISIINISYLEQNDIKIV